MFCYNCGNKCSDNAKFCVACGTKLQLGVPAQVVEEETAVAKEAVVAEPVVTEPVVTEPVETATIDAVMPEMPVQKAEPEQPSRWEEVKEEVPEEIQEEIQEEQAELLTDDSEQTIVLEQPKPPVTETSQEVESSPEPEDFFWKEETYSSNGDAEESSVPEVQTEPENKTVKEKQKKTKPEKPAKPQKVKKEKSAGGYFFSTFFSVIFMFLLIVLNVALISRIVVGGILGDSTKSGILQGINWATIPVGEMVADLEIDGVSVEEDDELSDVLLDVLQKARTRIRTEDQVEDLLNNIQLEGLFDDVKGEYVNLLIEKQDTASVKSKFIVDFVKDNKKMFKKELDIEIRDRDIELIENYLETNNFESKTSLKLAKDNKNIVTKICQIVIGENNICYILLGAAIIVMLLLILVCNLDKKRRLLVYTGVSLFVASGALLLASMFKGTLLAMAVKLDGSLLDDLLVGVGRYINKNALIFLAIGAGMVLFYIIVELIVKLVNRNRG
ncbi:MAG: hypothetical protein IKL28_01635 [Lachnospiraceae bacterium]|nr:hypothetical protein [Lachnospiraceae bacterium]